MPAFKRPAIGGDLTYIHGRGATAPETERMTVVEPIEDDDPLAAAHGLVNGVSLGVIIWAVIVAI